MFTNNKILTFEFVSLNIFCMLAFSNMAMFFNFLSYLQTIGITPEQAGLLIGVFSLMPILLTPLISPHLRPSNSAVLLLTGCLLLALCSVSYLLFRSFMALLILRILHGSCFVLLTTALLTLLVNTIPEERSAQAFGLFSLGTLVPYALVPCLMNSLQKVLSQPAQGYALMALLFIPAAAIPVIILKRGPNQVKVAQTEKDHRPSIREMRDNLFQPAVLMLLFINALYFISYCDLFYFFDTYAKQVDFKPVGMFFSLQMSMVIAIRILGGHLLDKWNKTASGGISFVIVTSGFIAIALMPPSAKILGLSLVFGLGTGIGMPLLNALMFMVSAPRFRGLNTNLMMMMMQAGFFIGPVAGGYVVSHYAFRGFFFFLAGINIMAAVFTALLPIKKQYHSNHNPL